MAELIQATEAYYSTVERFFTSDPLLLNLQCMAGHIKRERHIYLFLKRRNGEACGDSLMNGHWEELFGKVKELFDATDDLDNYHMHIQHIIDWSSDSKQYLESFLRLYVIKCVQGVIEAMSSLSASGYALSPHSHPNIQPVCYKKSQNISCYHKVNYSLVCNI